MSIGTLSIMSDAPTQIRTLGPDPDRDPAVAEAAGILSAGGLVALPTETVYGLAGNAADPAAIEAIFRAKNRPADNPLIVHLADGSRVDRFSPSTDPRVQRLTEAFWPGPLTLVLPARPAFSAVCRGLDTIALRVPDHPVALAVLRACDLGLAAPSANLSGKPSPTTAAHVARDLSGKIPLILDGGPCRVGIESTVLDVTGPRAVLLRPGAVTAEMLSAVLGEPPLGSGTDQEMKRSPGTRYRHYSPETPVYVVRETVDDGDLASLITQLEHPAYLGNRVACVRAAADVHIMRDRVRDLAATLYADLRAVDETGAGALVIDLHGLATDPALEDRLAKAASRIIGDDRDNI